MFNKFLLVCVSLRGQCTPCHWRPACGQCQGTGVNRRQTRESIKERRTSKQACNEDTKRNNIIKAKKRERRKGGVGLAEYKGAG